VKISQIRTLSTDRLGDKISRLSAGDLREILDGLLQLIG
jgi:mRNA-degrading endonuclease toxin of MazEF toxin-antitoxin module